MAIDPRTKCSRECLGKCQRGSYSCLSLRPLECACVHDLLHNATESRVLQTTSRMHIHGRTYEGDDGRLTKPPATRGVARLKACSAREVKVLSRHTLSGL